MTKETIIKNIPWIICIVLLAVVAFLTYKVAIFAPIVINDSKYQYLLKEHEQLQMDYNVAVNEATKWKGLADAKPKEIIKIKIRYVTIIDSVISLPVSDKEQLLAKRVYNR